MEDGERLQKFISRAGYASRRKAEKLITAGRVAVNGQPATVLGTRVRPGLDEVRVDGVVVRPPRIRWVVLNKPRGYLTTRTDPQRRKTVYDLLSDDLQGLAYVGRLDQGTEGLLLFTNDGDVASRLLHPSGGVEREYRAWVTGEVTPATIRRLLEGVELEDGRAKVKTAGVAERGPDRTLLQLVLVEGRKREVRRLCEAMGHPVRGLERVRFGPVRLVGVSRGEWRELTAIEVAALRAAVAKRGGASRGAG